MVDWKTVFDEVRRDEPATEKAVSGLRSFLSAPLTDVECAEIAAVQINPFGRSAPEHATWSPIDPTHWQLPDCELAPDFKDFLRWSNGGWARTGEREFGFFDIAGIRDYMLRYLFPEYMPGVVPFAFNGGGVFYAFDVRKPTENEYPIVAAASGVLDFHSSPILGLKFIDACRGRDNIEDILYPPSDDPPLPIRGDLWIIKPPNGLKEMASIKKLLGLDTSLGELREAMAKTPCRLASYVLCNRFDAMLTSSPELRQLLAVTELDSETYLDWP